MSKLKKEYSSRSRLIELTKLLDDDEINFCEYYIKNITLPIRLVVSTVMPDEPFPEQKSREIMTNPLVHEYLDLRRQVVRRAIITEDDVMLRMYDLLEKCSQPKPVLDNKGQPTGEMAIDTRGATKILELLAKHFKLDGNTNNAQTIAEPKTAVLSESDVDEFNKYLDDEF